VGGKGSMVVKLGGEAVWGMPLGGTEGGGRKRRGLGSGLEGWLHVTASLHPPLLTHHLHRPHHPRHLLPTRPPPARPCARRPPLLTPTPVLVAPSRAQTVGRTALGLIGDVAGTVAPLPGAPGGPASAQASGPHAAQAGSHAQGSHTQGGGGPAAWGRPPLDLDDVGGASFQDLFEAFGGRAVCEELEELANECARTCNRSRACLEGARAR
jgi:hypothetical protein